MRLIERLLQVSIASMAVLGTWMISLGGHTPLMTPLMLAAAVCGVLFTDILRWFQLHRLLVNLVAIAAMVLTLGDFMHRDSTGQLLSIAYLLIAWEAVMLFQEKTARVYWCVAVLSLLQVVVASVLNAEVKFGALMLLYMLVGFFGMVFFFLARELHRVEGRRRAAVRRNGALLAVAEDSPQQLAARLPLGRLTAATGALGLMSLLLAVVFFYGAPRLSGSQWQPHGRRTRASTGFTTEVTLREMGQILQSSDLAMRVRFSQHPTGDDYPVFGSPYLHGAVLTRYNNGAWSGTPYSDAGQLPAPPDAVDRDRLVRLDISMEPATSASLFTILPCYQVPGEVDPELQFLDGKQQLVRASGAEDRRRFRYALLTSGMRRGVQAAIRPQRTSRFGQSMQGMLAVDARDECLQIDPAQFPELIRLAGETLAKAPDASTVQKARLLEAHFLDAEYSYTLNFETVARRRDASLDPIEDFVRHQRAGHCEYFASALALMLRSQGIPARLVVGYHGGIRNRLAGDIQVLQLHAHAWVEAFVPPGEVPRSQMTAPGDYKHGGWLRLDPTPGGDAAVADRDRLDRVLDYAQLLWTDWVLEMNPETQRKTLDRAMGESGPLHLLDVSGWVAATRNTASRSLSTVRRWIGGRWFSWRAAAVAIALAMAAWAVGRTLAPLWARLRSRRRRGRERARRPTVDFYVRLERLLRRLGLRRRPQQTPREFAAEAAARMRAMPALAPAADLPLQVTDAFYRLRFGGGALDKQQTAAIERALRELADALRQTSRSTRQRPAS